MNEHESLCRMWVESLLRGATYNDKSYDKQSTKEIQSGWDYWLPQARLQPVRWLKVSLGLEDPNPEEIADQQLLIRQVVEYLTAKRLIEET